PGAVEGALRATGELETVLTERPLHAAEIAEAVSRGDAERIYIFSGGGGYNEVVKRLDGALPVGFIPGGPTSVFPRALGVPRDPVAAARALAASPAARPISPARVTRKRLEL